MLTNLHISNFRSFRELRVPGLTRVNLFVGPNNAGKTSILEAAEILSKGRVLSLWLSLQRRGEWAGVISGLAHLFHGHALQPGTTFLLRGADGADPALWVLCEVVAPEGPVRLDSSRLQLPTEEASELPLALRFSSHLVMAPLEFPLPSSGGPTDLPRSALQEAGSRIVSYLGTEALDLRELSRLWDEIVLTPKESKVVEALQIIEPAIERIAFSSAKAQGLPTIFLKLFGTDRRLPLGSVGDGMRRLLVLSVHLNAAQGGFLLVDEIDTGLYHSVMVDMWRMVIETARRLDVQVLATTHSLDCVRALAWLHESDPTLAGDVTLHRVERETTQTVSYSAEELAVAARHHIEVR